MGKHSAELQEPPTIGDLPDDVWPLLHTILDEHSLAKPTGQRRVDRRRVPNGSSVRVRPGCQGNQRPKRLGDDRTVHQHFQLWCPRGLLARIGAVLVESGDEWGGDWAWQAADTAMGTARMGGDLVGRHPTDRGQQR